MNYLIKTVENYYLSNKKAFVVLQTNYKTDEHEGPKHIIMSIHRNKTEADEKCAEMILDRMMDIKHYAYPLNHDLMDTVDVFMSHKPTGREILEFVNSNRQFFQEEWLISYEVQSYDLL